MGSKSAVDSSVFQDGRTALEVAYEVHREALKRFLTRRLRCPEIADDMMQETWLRVSNNSASNDALSNPRAYVFRIATNLAIDHFRRESRRTEILGELGMVQGNGVDELTPERQHFARAELVFMQQAVATLPERCRQVFYLSRYKQTPRHEIARLLGIGMTTVEKDLRRALQQLADARRSFRETVPIERGV